MLDDGTRLVPHSNPDADKTLVVLSDSVAFGYEVSDDQTFAADLARVLPSVRVINAAITRYNSPNVLRQFQHYPDADYFIWMIVSNDADPEIVPEYNYKVPYVSWTALYLTYLPFVLEERMDTYVNPFRDIDRYLREATEITADPRVLAVGFDNALTPITPNAVRIQQYPTSMMNSFSDMHPNPQGHQFLADEILPLLQERFGLLPLTESSWQK
jgi:lysophospholipase L1-like esterase